MAVITTPEDVIKILQATINFMDITLLGEALSPSADMERQETIDRLTTLITRLNQIKDTGFQSSSSSTKKASLTGKYWSRDKEKKEKSSGRESTWSMYMDMTDGIDGSLPLEKANVTIPDSKEVHAKSNAVAEAPNEEEEDDADDHDDHTYEIAQVDADNTSQWSKSSGISDNRSYEELQQKVKSLERCTPAELKVGATYAGYLLKHKKRMLTKWHKRYCILKDDFLFYFKSETDSKEQGVIILPGYTFSIPPREKGFSFTLESQDKTRDSYTFQADARDDIDKWKQYLLPITSRALSSEQIRMVNKIVLEHGESAKVEDIFDGGEIYDDVAPGQDIVQDIYDDITDNSNVEQDNQEIYDDVMTTEAEFTIQLNSPIVQPVETEGEMYELIPGQMQPPPPVPLPKRSPLNSPASEIPLRPSTPSLLPVLPPSRSSSEPAPLPSAKLTGDETFSIDNIFIGLYNCIGEDANDLSFNRGDLMYILEEIDMNWWLCFSNGKVGLVPSNYVATAFE